MSGTQSQIPRIVSLADRLIEDIESRQLEPGDSYMTTLAASKMLGVGNGVANRALQLLEKRNVIVRKQGKGSFIAHPAVKVDSENRLRNVHLLVHQRYFRSEGAANDGVLLGLQGELPGASVNISFLPSDDETSFVDSLIARSLNSNEQDGFVLVRVSLETQRHLANSGLPVVCLGSVLPSVIGLPSVTRNMFEVGQVLARYLIEQGNQTIVLFNRQTLWSGDNETLEGVKEEMISAGMNLDALHVYSVPADELAAAALATKVISESCDQVGFLCRTEILARGVEQVVAPAGRDNQRVSQIAVCDCYLKHGETSRFVYPQPTSTPEEQGRQIGRILALRSAGKMPEETVVDIPIRLFVPD